LKIKVFWVLLFLTLIPSQAQDSSTLFSKEINLYFQKGNFKKSDSIFRLKTSFLQKQDNLEEFLYAYWDYFMLNPSHERLFLLSKIENKVWRQPKNEDEHLARLHLWVNQGYHLKNFGKIYQSILAYENAWNYYENHPVSNYNIIDYCLKPLANNCTRIGDYSRAEDVLKRTLQLATTFNNLHQISTTLSNLATCYHSQGKYKKSNNVLQQALELKEKDPLQKSRLYSEMAQNYYSLKAYDKALKLLPLSNKDLPKWEGRSIYIKNTISQSICYYYLKQTKKALQSIEKTLSLAKNYYTKNDREIAKIYVLKAKIIEQNKDYKAALENYQKALQTLLPTFVTEDVLINPTINRLYPENTFKEIFDGKAEVFTLQKDYINAIKNYNLAFDIEDMLRGTYISQVSKIIQQSENKNRSAQVLNLYYQMNQSDKNPQLIADAFAFAEKSKSRVLWDELRYKHAKTKINNDILIIKEQKLLQKKASLNFKIKLNELAKNYSRKELERLHIEQDQTTNKLQLIKEQINKKYPFLSTQKFKETQLADIQNILGKHKQTLIEYFVGKEQTFIFLLNKDEKLNWRVLSNESYQNILQELLLFYADNNGSKIVNEIARFKELSNQLYQLLLAPEINQINTKELLIVPDAQLSFIPFDALLTSQTTSLEFNKFPFLLKDFTISYAYTSKNLLQEVIPEDKTHQFAGFFPVFSEKNRGLSPLVYTKEEAKNIKKHFSQYLYLKEKATHSQFADIESKTEIIHLSTHANIKNQTNQTQIEFYDQSLTLTELYAQKITADLLVLSACETGIGKLQKGEGAMSLARGFSYAGVKNLLVSLWQVNDKATSELMSNFYNYLTSGLSFQKALNQSKKHYLNDKSVSNSKKSPYYWAGFVPIQNTGTAYLFKPKQGLTYLFVVLGSILIVILSFLYLEKGNRN